MGENILAAVTPPSQTKKALSALQGLLGVFPAVDESPNNFGISLRNPGAVIHPGAMRSGMESLLHQSRSSTRVLMSSRRKFSRVSQTRFKQLRRRSKQKCPD